MKFDKNFFISQKFSSAELDKYEKSVKRDLNIAGSSKDSEVTFHFAFMALIKIGIYCLAQAGYRVKSRPGHHQKIIESLSQSLGSEDILIIGDKMRKDRNLDFYGADALCSAEEAREYLEFVHGIFKRMQSLQK